MAVTARFRARTPTTTSQRRVARPAENTVEIREEQHAVRVKKIIDRTRVRRTRSLGAAIDTRTDPRNKSNRNQRSRPAVDDVRFIRRSLIAFCQRTPAVIGLGWFARSATTVNRTDATDVCKVKCCRARRKRKRIRRTESDDEPSRKLLLCTFRETDYCVMFATIVYINVFVVVTIEGCYELCFVYVTISEDVHACVITTSKNSSVSTLLFPFYLRTFH